MRVIAGRYRSRQLKGPGKLHLRPTSDRLRETLFNVLGPSVVESLFVDVYAGTGAIGIEALSRGAREVVLIESNAATARVARQNLTLLDVHSGAEVIQADATRGLQKLSERHSMADFIFLDPPYAETAEHLRVLEYLDATHLIAPQGLVIVEHHHKMSLPGRFDRLERTRLIEQGEASLSFYSLAAAA
jgi:16S rRNA (guanine966-N2)-methyltransferase